MKKNGIAKFVAAAALGAAILAGPVQAQQVHYVKSPGWMSSLPQMLYLIDGCIGRSGDPSNVVTKAWFVNDRQAAVRLESDSGARAQCVIDRHSRQVVAYQRLDPADKLPGEYQPVFIRRGQKTIEEHRLNLIRVEDKEGERLGWAFVPRKS